MAEPNAGTNIPRQTAAVGLKLGTTTIEFKGPLAVIPIVIVLVPLVIAVYLVSRTTQTMLWASAILWILFIVYWSAVAGYRQTTWAVIPGLW